MANQIGTLAEKSLHAALKDAIGQPNDRYEVRLDGFFIDIMRGDLLIEIQTGNFGAMKRKLNKLLRNHKILLIHPLAEEKWIVRETAAGRFISRRKSPKKCKPLHVFKELVRIPHLINHPNLLLGIWMTRQEEVWRDDGQGSWRRKHWSKADVRLLDVVSTHVFANADELLGLLPVVERPFSNKQLAQSANIPIKLAQQTTYTLRHASLLMIKDKRGNSLLYDVSAQ